MIWVALFITSAATAAVASWWRGNYERSLAFVFVTMGLVIMAAISGNAGGVIAFAVWTIVSYLLLNFPAAATLYLLSAFCYILELQGQWLWAIQVVSDIAGVAGLVAIGYGTPKWRYTGLDRSRSWGGLAVDFNTAQGCQRYTQADQEKKPS